MDRITVQENQSLRDLAISNYGTLEAIEEIIRINGDTIVNDKSALVAAGIDYASDTAFYIDIALEVGLSVLIDRESKLSKRNIIREINTPQTKYEQWQEQ